VFDVGAVSLRALPPLCIVVVSPCRCEPLQAGCSGGGGGGRGGGISYGATTIMSHAQLCRW